MRHLAQSVIYWYYMRSTPNGAPDLDPVSPDALSQESVDLILRGMRARNITQRQLAAELEKDESTVSRWFKRKSPVPMGALRHIAARIGSTPPEILAGHRLAILPPPRETAHSGNLSQTSPRQLDVTQDSAYAVPPRGLTLALLRVEWRANVHADVTGEGGSGDMIDTPEYVAVLVDTAQVGMLRAVRIQGGCMEPTIKRGDVVVVDLSRRHIKDGDVVCAVIAETQERVVRRFYSEGRRVWLVPDAEGFDVAEFADDQIEVLGVVTQGTYTVARSRKPLRLNGHHAG